MQIFHIATAADWAAAQQSGAYWTSTRGVTLEQEGFLHAARPDQVDGVFDRYYRDAGEPLVRLTIDTDRLDVPWREDPVGDDTYPHVYGPLSPGAVVSVDALDQDGRTGLRRVIRAGHSSPVATGRSGSATHSLHEPR